MLADIHIFHKSDVYQIVDFKCHCDLCSLSNTEYNKSFCVSFIRHGFFEYRTFRRKDEVHVGRILLSKTAYEHTTRHIDNQPDITTVFEFTLSFFQHIQSLYRNQAGWFLLNNDIHSVLLNCTPETEYLHHRIMQHLRKKDVNGMQLDEMVMQLLEKVIGIIGNEKTIGPLPANLIKYHLPTIEKAKEYILQHFKENISLQQLAGHCLVSPFHFSRIFKSILQKSPHQYLTELRLHHASILLNSTTNPVTDIAFDCGFNSLEHFTTAYRQRFGISPGNYRRKAVSF